MTATNGPAASEMSAALANAAASMSLSKIYEACIVLNCILIVAANPLGGATINTQQILEAFKTSNPDVYHKVSHRPCHCSPPSDPREDNVRT